MTGGRDDPTPSEADGEFAFVFEADGAGSPSKCFSPHQRHSGTACEPARRLLDPVPCGTLPGCACCAEPSPDPEPHEPSPYRDTPRPWTGLLGG